MAIIQSGGCSFGNSDRYRINMVRGDSFAKGLTVKMGGVPLMLSENAVVRFAIRSSENPMILKTYTAEEQDADGKINITLSPADTENLPADNYEYEIEIEDGSMTITPIQSVLTLLEDIITPEVRGNA